MNLNKRKEDYEPQLKQLSSVNDNRGIHQDNSETQV